MHCDKDTETRSTQNYLKPLVIALQRMRNINHINPSMSGCLDKTLIFIVIWKLSHLDIYVIWDKLKFDNFNLL